MANEQSPQDQRPTPTASDELTHEVQSLTFALLDEQIAAEQIKRLEELLTSDAQAREIYLTCVQMHVDLHEVFAAEKNAEKKTTDNTEKPASPSAAPPLGLPISLPAPGINTPLDHS